VSSFLRRVVASAQTSAGSVRPILGSVYSRPTPARMAQDSDDESADEAAAQDISQSASVGAQSGFERNAPAPDARHTSPQDAAPHPTDRRLVIESERFTAPSPDSAAGAASHDPVPASTSAPQSISSRAAGGDFPAGARSRTTAEPIEPALAAADYTPLIPGATAPPASGQGALALAPEPAPAPARASPNTAALLRADAAERNAGAARRAQPPARAADDIQIHIGRIEVTAALPAPPRPAAAPPAAARKSPSLGELLKRRKGRIG
jgi:hypothetical protein